jgi:hypothetical protein
MSKNQRYLLIGGLISGVSLFFAYYLITWGEKEMGYIFLAITIVNYVRMQRKIRGG